MRSLNAEIKADLHGSRINEWLRELRTYKRQEARAALYSQEVFAFEARLREKEIELEMYIKKMKRKLKEVKNA